MRMFRGFVIGTAALIAASVAYVAAAADAINVTGTWTMTVQTAAGTGSPTFTLTQDGDKVSGTYKGQLGEFPVTGTVKGSDVELTYNASGPQGEAKIEYLGKVDAAGAMKGTVKLGPLGEGTFEGKKQ